MKKLLLSLIVFAGFVGVACADNYTVALTSYVKTGGVSSFSATYPNITGGVAIDRIEVTTADAVTSPMLIGIYDTASSTTAATVDYYTVLTGTSTTNASANRTVIDFPYYNPLKLTNPGFFKADGDTSHTVYINVQYR